MNYFIAIFINFLFLLNYIYVHCSIEENQDPVTAFNMVTYEEGKALYQGFHQKTRKYGVCWQKAYDSLHESCNQLDDKKQSRLALAFSNCFFENLGKRTYHCDYPLTMEDCEKQFDVKAYHTFVEFYTQTQSICFYLQNQNWQLKAEETINKLTWTSLEVKDRIESSAKSLNHLENLQHKSINAQSLLYEQINSSYNAIKEFKESTEEQRYIVKEILDRFINLQGFVLTEYSSIYIFLYFIIAVVIIYFFTATSRTANARFWLYFILIIQVIFERFIASYSVSNDEILFYGLKISFFMINEQIWVLRKLVLAVMFAVFFVCAYTHKDHEKENNKLLKDIHRRLSVIELSKKQSNGMLE